MNFKTLIIDDDANGIQAIKNIINQFDFPAEVIGSAQTLEDGISLLKKHQPDLLFLDIEMKNESGFDLFDIWNPNYTKVVFCTGYDQYAIQALKKGAYDYILKPLDYKEFLSLFKRLQEDHSPSLQDKKDPAVMNKISIKSPGGIYIIDICEINFLKADGRYTLINYDSGKDCTSSKNLGQFEDEINCGNFKRVNKSLIINMDRLKGVDKRGLKSFMYFAETESEISDGIRRVLLKLME